MRIEQITEHNGLMLKDAYNIDTNMVVLTGKNGSGKTRLFEAIRDNKVRISMNGTQFERTQINFVPHNILNPNIGGKYQDYHYQGKISATCRLYDKDKSLFAKELTHEELQSMHRPMSENGAITPAQLFELVKKISKTTGKARDNLSHKDIEMFFEEPLDNLLGMQNLSIIINQYIKRKHKNQENEWKKKEKKANVQFYTEDEFIYKFGEKPWIIFNKILSATFEKKFSIPIPNEEDDLSYSYEAILLENESTQISPQHLSSGEKTLLWLAITLFNSQYYQEDHSKAPKVLLLDEPDAFLHPKMVVNMYIALQEFQKNFNTIILFTTHSPTTIALAPENNNVYLIESNQIQAIDKDTGISELLDGITQITIDPENMRQVYVESFYDDRIFQKLFGCLQYRSQKLDPKIILNFASSGPKIPDQLLKDKITQVLKITDQKLADEFIETVNGAGNCSQVYGIVESLTNKGNKTVRGLVDWDNKNTDKNGVFVFAKNHAYAIENIILDPVNILLMLHYNKPDKYTATRVCGENSISWESWIQSDALLQNSVDILINDVLGVKNARDEDIRYFSGRKVKTDSRYLLHHGHNLEDLVKKTYPELNQFCRQGRDGELKYNIVNNIMVTLSAGKLIPSTIEDTLAMLQKG